MEFAGSSIPLSLSLSLTHTHTHTMMLHLWGKLIYHWRVELLTIKKINNEKNPPLWPRLKPNGK
jgi:hypothetical protein